MKNKSNKNSRKLKGNIFYLILGLFFPAVGLSLYFVWKDDKKGDSKLSLIGSIIGFVLKIAIFAIYLPYLFSLSSMKYECIASGGYWSNDNRCYYDEYGYYDGSEQITLLECENARTGDLRVKKGDIVSCLVEFPIISDLENEHEFDLSYGLGLKLTNTKISPSKEHSGTHFVLNDNEKAIIEFEVIDDSNEDELSISLVNYINDEFDNYAGVEYITEEFLEIEE